MTTPCSGSAWKANLLFHPRLFGSSNLHRLRHVEIRFHGDGSVRFVLGETAGFVKDESAEAFVPANLSYFLGQIAVSDVPVERDRHVAAIAVLDDFLRAGGIENFVELVVDETKDRFIRNAFLDP